MIARKPKTLLNLEDGEDSTFGTDSEIPTKETSEIPVKPRVDARERRLFQSIDQDNDGQVTFEDYKRAIEASGLKEGDPRLKASFSALKASVDNTNENQILCEQFCHAIRHNILLTERALQGNLIIPDFTEFCGEIEEVFTETNHNSHGETASYIPQLNLCSPEADQFGVSACTIDGQRCSVGDAETFFTVQSCCKPIGYCLALEEHDTGFVHRHVGREPSGQTFNELTLDRHNRPHNPMINAGAIMTSALIKLSEKSKPEFRHATAESSRGWDGTRFDYIMNRWQVLAGGTRPRFNNSVYLSERQTADRNFALAYFMREKGAFPSETDLNDVLDFYFQCCSIELNAQMMSVVAATLANNGICPLTGERLLNSDTVQHCLSLMSTCGMYDYSGEFAFSVGLPAKSGVSGAIMIVIPNVMGLCTWSPRLDAQGNSVRGIEFCKRLVDRFSFHHYADILSESGKKDPRFSHVQRRAKEVNELVWAASKGHLGAIQNRIRQGADIDCADYDLRTPFHLAAAEGQIGVVEFFIEQHRSGKIDLNPKDRWGGTPLDDAALQGHHQIVKVLQRAGGRRGRHPRRSATGTMASASPKPSSDKTDELIWAASLGNLTHVHRLVARGATLNCADYDRRPPLHLAAAEGRLGVVRYLISQGVDINPRDRWNGTPLLDAIRHHQTEVADFLTQHGATPVTESNETMKASKSNLGTNRHPRSTGLGLRRTKGNLRVEGPDAISSLSTSISGH